ncbi:MAG: glycosyltransferase, partial [Imperialibacter sp.]
FTEARFIYAEGNYYVLESSFSNSLFKRYLTYFERVTVCARVREGLLDEVLEANKVNNEGVTVYPLPYYVGFNQFLLKFFLVRSAIRKMLKSHATDNSAVLCRVPGRIGSMAVEFLKKRNMVYGIEVVGDPYDVLSNGATNHALAWAIRYFSFSSLKKTALAAPAVLYVTERMLQTRYPNNSFNVGVSDVVLHDDAYSHPKSISLIRPDEYHLICVGSLEQMYKAPDVMLRAVKIIVASGINVHMHWIGDGFFKDKMIQLSHELAIEKHVTFHGKLPGGEAVRRKLDMSDVFVMPSRMEGLPRAMVEAMARGLPCIGTKLCGIQELLDKEFLVPVNNVQELASKTLMVLNSSDLRREQSMRNYNKSLSYREEVLKPKRDLFYNHLMAISAKEKV